MNGYAVLADIIVFIHLAYILFAVGGQLAILVGWPLGWGWIRNPWFRFIHLAMVGVVALEALFGVACPLTTWEGGLREAAGQVILEGGVEVEGISFIGRLLRNTLFVDVSWAAEVRWGYYIAAGIVAATLLLVPPRFRRASATPAQSSLA